jgi:hypothetical protein
MAIRDVQSEIIERLKTLLEPVAPVEEGDVRAIFDDQDETLADEFIVLQPGSTSEELAGHPRMPNSVPERVTVNIVLVSKKRLYAPVLRRMRLEVKVAMAGQRCGLESVGGVQTALFQTETPTRPSDGARWAAHVMPLVINYIQPLN